MIFSRKHHCWMNLMCYQPALVLSCNSFEANLHVGCVAKLVNLDLSFICSNFIMKRGWRKYAAAASLILSGSLLCICLSFWWNPWRSLQFLEHLPSEQPLGSPIYDPSGNVRKWKRVFPPTCCICIWFCLSRCGNACLQESRHHFVFKAIQAIRHIAPKPPQPMFYMLLHCLLAHHDPFNLTNQIPAKHFEVRTNSSLLHQ